MTIRKINPMKNLSLTACLAALWLMPLATMADDEDYVWQSGFNYVALVPSESGAEANDHPVEFQPQEMFDILATIKLQEADDSWFDLDFLSSGSEEAELPDTNLFNRKELSDLSKPLTQALAKASPNQDVTFTVSSSREIKYGKSLLSTAGRFFYSKGQLNLIIGKLRVDIEQQYRKRGGPSDVAEKIDYLKLKKFRLDTGSRKRESSLDHAFATDHSHFIKPVNRKFRSDWLVMNVDTIRNDIANTRETLQKKENIIEETTGLQEQTRQIDSEQEQLKQKVERLEQMIQADEKGAAVEPVRKTSPANVESRTIEERLSELKSLYEKGMITEEIYQKKMNDILKDL